MIVKPERHVTSAPSLTDDESAVLGPLIRKTSAIAAQIVSAE